MTEADPSNVVQRLLDECAAKPKIFTNKEVEFLRSISAQLPRPLSGAQMEWLQKLAARELIDFAAVNRAALIVLQTLCKRWLSDGVLYGKEWVAKNPTRADGRAGSFRINVQTGQWADFAQAGAKGGDPISLAAYLHCGGDQIEGALSLKRMLNL